MTRVTSALVLGVLLGAAGIRLGCAWSCQPSQVAADEHCHETSVAAFEFSASAVCNDVRSGGPLLVAASRSDAAMFTTFDQVTPFSLVTDDGVHARPASTRQSLAPSPPAFVIPLRQ